MNLLKSLGEALQSNPAIFAEVETRIYRDTNQSAGITPFIVYKKTSAETDQKNLNTKKTTTVKIDCVDNYENQDELEVLRENVKNLLAGKCGILTEDWQGKIILTEEKDDYDDILRQAVRSLTFNFLEF